MPSDPSQNDDLNTPLIVDAGTLEDDTGNANTAEASGQGQAPVRADTEASPAAPVDQVAASSPAHDIGDIPDVYPLKQATHQAAGIGGEALTAAPVAHKASPAPAVPTSYTLVWRDSPNFWAGRNNNQVLAIVNHGMNSSIESADAWFHNPASQVSSHFGVARDGRIWQWVRTEDTAWANGIANNPATSIGWIADKVVHQNLDANYFTLSIEHEGNSGNPLTEAQYQATRWLHKHLIVSYGLVADRQHIIGHYQIDSVNRSFCPGPAFPWDRLLSDLATDLIVPGNFGPGTVLIEGAYVRAKPSFGQDGTVIRKLAKGTVLRFVAYTDGGPMFQGGTRWYQISPDDGGGWIHSKQIG